MLLITNADDLGLSENRDRGIFESYSVGVVRSATLLVNTPTSKTAAAQAKKLGLPLGLHFNLSEGIPLSSPKKLQSILQPYSGISEGLFDGLFSGSEFVFPGRRKLYEFLLKEDEAVREAVEIELRAQIEKFIEYVGDVPTHLDGHQHAHIIGLSGNVCAKVLPEYGIRFMRLPRESVDNCFWLREEQRELLKAFAFQIESGASERKAKGILSTSRFFGSCTMGAHAELQRTVGRLRSLYSQAQKDENPSIEWMLHPGYRCTSWDNFNCSKEREQELEMLLRPELASFCKSQGFVLGSYRDL